MIENMHSGILQGLICAAQQHLIWHINTKGKEKKKTSCSRIYIGGSWQKWR